MGGIAWDDRDDEDTYTVEDDTYTAACIECGRQTMFAEWDDEDICIACANRADDAEDTEDGRPVVRLIGEDGNVFAIMGRVRKALADAGRDEQASECLNRMTAAGSYDEALQVVFEYCEVR